MLILIIRIVALVFLALAAVKCPAPNPRIDWGWLGAFLFALSLVVPST